MTVASYSYPVVPRHSAPAVRHKLSHRLFVVFAIAVLGVLVVAVTTAVVATSPSTELCHYSCGPAVGPRLLSPTAYTSSAYGYRVEYYKSELRIVNQTSSQVEFEVPSQKINAVVFDGTSGSDVEGALEQAVSGLNTNVIQNLRETGPVPGAEIGAVEGTGTAYSADFFPPGGGQSYPVTVVAMAATRANLTITVVAIGQRNLSSVDLLPFGLVAGGLLDAAITGTIWPGSS